MAQLERGGVTALRLPAVPKVATGTSVPTVTVVVEQIRGVTTGQGRELHIHGVPKAAASMATSASTAAMIAGSLDKARTDVAVATRNACARVGL